MWPDLPIGVLYMHSFRSHFSWLFDRYNNRPTVHACTVAKASTVCFYWGFIHRPVWRPRMLGWSVNGSNFPSQVDSWQGITTWLAGETGHQCSYILRWGVSIHWTGLLDWIIFLLDKYQCLFLEGSLATQARSQGGFSRFGRTALTNKRSTFYNTGPLFSIKGPYLIQLVKQKVHYKENKMSLFKKGPPAFI